MIFEEFIFAFNIFFKYSTKIFEVLKNFSQKIAKPTVNRLILTDANNFTLEKVIFISIGKFAFNICQAFKEGFNIPCILKAPNSPGINFAGFNQTCFLFMKKMNNK